MKKISLSLLCTMCVWAVNAQTHYLRISQLNGNVTKVAVNTIDSIDFVTEAGDPTPDEPARTEINGHEYVDLGLPSGTLWATCNIGASSPEIAGDFFAWGEPNPNPNNEYFWNSYSHCEGSSNTITKYSTDRDFGTVDNKITLKPSDDAAHVHWGSTWRMPTKTEQDELLTECTWTWTTFNNQNGYRVTGPSENSIFLPVTGYRTGSSPAYVSSGYYWSSSLYTQCRNAYALYFGSTKQQLTLEDRYIGQAIRPVSSPQ